MLGLLGRNGAGKSTCMNVTIGLLPPRRGEVVVFGETVTGMSPEMIAARGVALVPQGRRIFKSLTVRENLMVAARKPDAGSKHAPWTIDTVFGMFPRLSERRNQIAAHLSGGEQQMLAIGRALMGNPRVLLMDEPSEGLAPQIVAEVMATIRKLKESGLSIVLVEQNPKLVFDVADDIVILNTGRVAVVSTPAKTRKRRRRSAPAPRGVLDFPALKIASVTRLLDRPLSRTMTNERLEMADIWNKYANTAARKHGKPGRDVRPKSITIDAHTPYRGAARGRIHQAASRCQHHSARAFRLAPKPRRSTPSRKPTSAAA